MDRESMYLLKRKLHELNERIKELNCLYGISEIAGDPNFNTGQTLSQIVSIIRKAWQYPDITCVKVKLEDQEYKTENFRDSIWKQTAGIKTNEQQLGTLEVCYLEKKPESYEGPFLKEERRLINEIAERIVRIIERKNLEQERIRLQDSLRKALDKVLSGLLPICVSCKKIRDERGAWQPVEVYLRNHTGAEFTHGICPDCGNKLYPGFFPKS